MNTFHRWLRVTAAVLALTALTVLPAQAGVEYVTAGDCRKVWTTTDGEFSIIAGQNIRFRVFGNSIDFDNGFSFETRGESTARIVSRGTACGDLNNTGFALVEVNSPLTLTSNVTLRLNFTMPLGDISRLDVTIKPLPQFGLTWASQSVLPCITKTGPLEQFNQDLNIRIPLPAGHREDRTNCPQRTLSAVLSNSEPRNLTLRGPASTYSVTGLPPFMTASLIGTGVPFRAVMFTIDVAGIRALTTTSNYTITVTSPNPALTRTLNLEVVPNLSNGFTQDANCRNRTTGDTVDVDFPFVCELRLAFPPAAGAGQLISFQVQLAHCVEPEGGENPAGLTDFGYSKASGEGKATLQGPGTIFEVPFRAKGESGCASATGIQHEAQFWIGPEGVRSGANFTRDTFLIRLPRRQ